MPKQHYYTNTLQPVQLDKTTLRRTLRALRHAVIQGTNVVQSDSPGPRNPSDYGSVYSGVTGTALAFLRLEHQKNSLVDDDDDDDDDDDEDEGQDTSYLPDFAQLAQQRTLPASNAPDMRRHVPSAGRISPIGSSSLSTLIVRILAACQDPSRRPIPRDDIRALNSVVQHALDLEHVTVGSSASGERSGVDEVLYGRAGLLWAVLSISGYVGNGDEDGDGDGEPWRALRPVCEAVPRLVDVIVDAGKRGARDFVAVYGERDAFPLMWLYKDERYSLGSMHGIAGILTILLSSPPSALTTHLPFVAATITHLCKISITNNGHLPTSIPPRSSHSRAPSSPLVQICHGAPGLLVLLATARIQPHLRANFWQPYWDDALRLSAARVWEEGLLVKGGGLCHGLCGNAWALLVVHAALEVDIERGLGSGGTQEASDDFLARALALLLLARECPPYSAAVGVSSSFDFRLPDRPYSLFEGLAGELCAWAEACVALQVRLCKLGLGRGPGSVREFKGRELGFPGLGCPVHLVRNT